MGAGRLTRAGVASQTGLSRPTASAAVERLIAAGVIDETGERSTGPGRSAGYVRLSDGLGIALTLEVGPAGTSGRALDLCGQELAQIHLGETASDNGAETADHAALLAEAAAELASAAGRAVWTVTVSVADPVDAASGRVVQLPDEPFLVGELDPRQVLGGVLANRGEAAAVEDTAARAARDIIVDNDVNWIARGLGEAESPRAFSVIHLGTGLGAAVVEGGVVLRGSAGLAGEIAHIVVAGPGGEAMALTDVFDRLGLRLPGTTALDIERVRAAWQDKATAMTLARALTGVVAAQVGLVNPAQVVLTGPWAGEAGKHVAAQVAAGPRPVDVVVVDEADLIQRGLHVAALAHLRQRVDELLG